MVRVRNETKRSYNRRTPVVCRGFIPEEGRTVLEALSDQEGSLRDSMVLVGGSDPVILWVFDSRSYRLLEIELAGRQREAMTLGSGVNAFRARVITLDSGARALVTSVNDVRLTASPTGSAS